MSQYFPNFVEQGAGQHGGASIQSARVSYFITANDVTNGYAQIPVLFDKAFPDANYTVQYTVELPTANDLQTAYVPSFLNAKTAAGFTAGVSLKSSVLSGGGGDKIVLHVVAFHD